ETVAAVSTDHVAEKLAEGADVGVLSERSGGGCHAGTPEKNGASVPLRPQPMQKAVHSRGSAVCCAFKESPFAPAGKVPPGLRAHFTGSRAGRRRPCAVQLPSARAEYSLDIPFV